jgi:hypothetical protein
MKKVLLRTKTLSLNVALLVDNVSLSQPSLVMSRSRYFGKCDVELGAFFGTMKYAE